MVEEQQPDHVQDPDHVLVRQFLDSLTPAQRDQVEARLAANKAEAAKAKDVETSEESD